MTNTICDMYSEVLKEYYLTHCERFQCNANADTLSEIVLSICSAVINDSHAASNFKNYIQIADAKSESAEEQQLILCMVWATLTLKSGITKQTKLFLNSLYHHIRQSHPFRYWNNFATAMHQKHGYLTIDLSPYDNFKIHNEATTSQQAQAIALQSVPQGHPTIHQTLLFPNVQQFNNNPRQVINNPSDK